MAEGPYRDLGSGFARLTGLEGARRGPSRLSFVEDALLELLRNARDADARNVFVASTLTGRRFRTLTVLDDGRGIPEPYASLVFEPGVTTRHLNPVPDPTRPSGPPHGAGLSLYHIREAALEARVLSPSSPTALRVTFDTRTMPERSLQSPTRPSKTNLRSTVQTFAQNSHPNPPKTFYGPPARILATLLHNRIIQLDEGSRERAGRLRDRSLALGLEISLRTAQRVLRGEVAALREVSGAGSTAPSGGSGRDRGSGAGGPVLSVGAEDRALIADILGRAAKAEYLEIEDLRLEARPGEVAIRARVYEPEEEYE
jgi:hypothetical protein